MKHTLLSKNSRIVGNSKWYIRNQNYHTRTAEKLMKADKPNNRRRQKPTLAKLQDLPDK